MPKHQSWVHVLEQWRPVKEWCITNLNQPIQMQTEVCIEEPQAKMKIHLQEFVAAANEPDSLTEEKKRDLSACT